MQQVTIHPAILFVISFALMAFAAWFGSAVLRPRMPLGDHAREDFRIVQSATLTLLALVIGFSLSMAVGRYDQRKNYEEEEANAIGTEYLRAGLLASNEAAAIRSMLAQYTELRIEYYQTRDAEHVARIDSATADLQNRLWSAAERGSAGQPNPLSALAVGGMNDVINTQGYTQAAWRNRIPMAAWILMFVIGIFGNLMVGYAIKIESRKNRFLLIMPLTVSLSFFLIADIDSPRNGVIRVAPLNLISTLQSLPRT